MSEGRHLNHAKHNEEACDYLNLNAGYGDWVITTAFYSVLHYVNHKLFPSKKKVGGKEQHYRNFDTYYMDKKYREGYRGSKHRATIDLVRDNLPGIHIDFKKLFDLSQNARYVNYQFSPKIVKHSRKRLRRISRLSS